MIYYNICKYYLGPSTEDITSTAVISSENTHNLLTQSSDKEVATYALKQITCNFGELYNIVSIKTHNKHTFSECVNEDAKQSVHSSLPMYDCLHK